MNQPTKNLRDYLSIGGVTLPEDIYELGSNQSKEAQPSVEAQSTVPPQAVVEEQSAVSPQPSQVVAPNTVSPQPSQVVAPTATTAAVETL